MDPYFIEGLILPCALKVSLAELEYFSCLCLPTAWKPYIFFLVFIFSFFPSTSSWQLLRVFFCLSTIWPHSFCTTLIFVFMLLLSRFLFPCHLCGFSKGCVVELEMPDFNWQNGGNVQQCCEMGSCTFGVSHCEPWVCAGLLWGCDSSPGNTCNVSSCSSLEAHIIIKNNLSGSPGKSWVWIRRFSSPNWCTGKWHVKW